MKKTILLVLAVVTVICQFSCSNDEPDVDLQELDFDIKNLENFEYSLGFFGDEQGARISEQAKYFEISELEDDVNREIIYTYKSEIGFTGVDFVEIEFVSFDVSTGLLPVEKKLKITFNISD
ncbi:hypothetical protein [Aestuariibaculum suncheonense]|uniref:DUF4377 domain-containing protein n=1 Tax=Aestuariibaculum suncheonense TaxID=1028745 RepID=A0A8J6UBH4_9FLAO|nr:hypothetical protein [Aestuariibaculum suncheonense]MBD0836293.1 hypothetical protein [Aestuariibaculum suncheonense]